MNLNEQVAKSDNEIEQKDMIFGFSLKHNLSKNWNCFEKNSSFCKGPTDSFKSKLSFYTKDN